jgi:hypothetical protein
VKPTRSLLGAASSRSGPETQSTRPRRADIRLCNEEGGPWPELDVPGTAGAMNPESGA